jgi:hypothetical protein
MKRNSRCLLSIVLLGREKVKAITRPPGCVTALRVAEVGVMQATWVRTAGGKQSYTWRSQDKIFRVWTHLGLTLSLDWPPCPHPSFLLPHINVTTLPNHQLQGTLDVLRRLGQLPNILFMANITSLFHQSVISNSPKYPRVFLKS